MEIGSQFTTYMSIVNLSDLLGAFISGQLQRFFPAHVIGIGCAVLIIVALITVASSLWWSRKRLRKVKIEMKP